MKDRTSVVILNASGMESAWDYEYMSGVVSVYKKENISIIEEIKSTINSWYDSLAGKVGRESIEGLKRNILRLLAEKEIELEDISFGICIVNNEHAAAVWSGEVHGCIVNERSLCQLIGKKVSESGKDRSIQSKIIRLSSSIDGNTYLLLETRSIYMKYDLLPMIQESRLLDIMSRETDIDRIGEAIEQRNHEEMKALGKTPDGALTITRLGERAFARSFGLRTRMNALNYDFQESEIKKNKLDDSKVFFKRRKMCLEDYFRVKIKEDDVLGKKCRDFFVKRKLKSYYQSWYQEMKNACELENMREAAERILKSGAAEGTEALDAIWNRQLEQIRQLERKLDLYENQEFLHELERFEPSFVELLLEMVRKEGCTDGEFAENLQLYEKLYAFPEKKYRLPNDSLIQRKYDRYMADYLKLMEM